MTDRQKILKILLDTRVNNKPFIHLDGGPDNRIIRSGGYLPMHHFNWVCSARDVRLRELRRLHLVPITDPPHVFSDAWYYTAAGKRVRYTLEQYRIEMTPEEILAYDWSGAWERPFRWKYRQNIIPVAIAEGINGQLGMVV